MDDRIDCMEDEENKADKKILDYDHYTLRKASGKALLRLTEVLPNQCWNIISPLLN